MDRTRAAKAWRALAQWFDAGTAPQPTDAASRDRVDWARIVPFVGMHLACRGVLWVGISPVAVGVAVVLYVLRMFQSGATRRMILVCRARDGLGLHPYSGNRSCLLTLRPRRV